MVIDKIENSKLYTGLSERIAKAFDYISKNDLAQMEVGKYMIDNDDVFVLVQEYDTKEKENCKLEAHYKYIDIQYMLEGSEVMGVTSLTDQEPYEKNDAKDVAFYKDDTSLVKVGAGMFAIFFPDDLHMPCIKSGQISKVKKAVFKVRM